MSEHFVTNRDATAVRFRMRDADHAVQEVRLWLDLVHNVEPQRMAAVDGGWQLEIARPPVQRLEYLFVLRFRDGSEAMVCDPANPRRVSTASGDHSVIEFPGYLPPAWLGCDADGGQRVEIVVRAPALRRAMPITIWSPSGGQRRDPLPLLAVHDGPEFDRLGALTRFSAAMIAAGRLPAHRIALLGPGDRNRWYAAQVDYARALRRVALPAIRNTVGVAGPTILAGASLGALAALHAAVTEPGIVDGLFLQSGSFFRREHDLHEGSFAGFTAIADFVESLQDGPAAGVQLDVAMTAGLGEENMYNNRLMAATLTQLGHRTVLAEVADAHTYVGWRDALDPHLVDLLNRVWTR